MLRRRLSKWFPNLTTTSPDATPVVVTTPPVVATAAAPPPVVPAVPVTSGSVVVAPNFSAVPPAADIESTVVPGPVLNNIFASPSISTGPSPALSPPLELTPPPATATATIAAATWAPTDVARRSIDGAAPVVCADALTIVRDSPADFGVLGQAITVRA